MTIHSFYPWADDYLGHRILHDYLGHRIPHYVHLKQKPNHFIVMTQCTMFPHSMCIVTMHHSHCTYYAQLIHLFLSPLSVVLDHKSSNTINVFMLTDTENHVRTELLTLLIQIGLLNALHWSSILSCFIIRLLSVYYNVKYIIQMEVLS